MEHEQKYEQRKELFRQAAKKHPNEVLHPYNKILGMEGFDAICEFAEQVNGFTIYVPSARTIFAKCLEIEAKNDFQKGLTIVEIARKYGYGDRHMRRILM